MMVTIQNVIVSHCSTAKENNTVSEQHKQDYWILDLYSCGQISGARAVLSFLRPNQKFQSRGLVNSKRRQSKQPRSATCIARLDIIIRGILNKTKYET